MNTPDFSDLDAVVNEWGLESAAERLNKRMTSSVDELQAFYDAIGPRLEEIIEFLNGFPLTKIPDQYQKLSYMALAVLEVDDPLNYWKRPTLDHASDPRTWRTKESFYDTNLPEWSYHETRVPV